AAGTEGFGQKSPLQAWEVGTGKLLAQFEPLQNYTVQVALSPDGKVMASWGQHLPRNGEGDKKRQELSPTTQLWDTPTGKEIRHFKSDAGQMPIRAAFSPDGKTLATGYGGSTIVLWDPAKGEEVRRLAGRRGVSTYLFWSADGKMLAGASQDGVI